MSSYASPELVEILDRVIGNNIYDLPNDEILPTFKAFMSAKKSRTKIFEALYLRLKKNLIELSFDELCEIPYMFTFLNGEFLEMYDLVEPYILNKFH